MLKQGDSLEPFASIHRTRGLLILLAALPLSAGADQIDDYVKARMQKGNIPGLSLAIVKNGRVVRAGGYGYANVELKVPPTEETAYEIGSTTKSFTATAVMMLVEEGKIGLDEKIGSYLSGLPEPWRPITVRQLLSHTSGIKEYVQDMRQAVRDMREPADAFKAVGSAPLQFPPGSRARYSNTNFVLLGLMVEKVAGEPYSTFLSKRIFNPLGMSRTRMNDPEAVILNRAQGYRWRDGKLWNQPGITEAAAFSAGGLISTVKDLAKFDDALYSGQLLKPGTREMMWTPVKLADGSSPGVLNFGAYGLGWGLDEHDGHRCVWHGGSSLGFRGAFLDFPEDRLSIVVLTNLNSAGADSLAFALAGMMNPSLGLFAPGSMLPQPDDQPQLTAKLRQYLLDFIANNGKDLAIMTPGLIRDIRPSERVEQAFLVTGLKSFSFVAREDVSRKRMSRLGASVDHIQYCRLINSQGSFLVTFWMAAEGKIADWIASRE
jgi:CubicO group peptidase (beta-lactamase class C family)